MNTDRSVSENRSGTRFLWVMAKGTPLRWVHRALALALDMSGRKEVASEGERWAAQADRWMHVGRMGRREAITIMGGLAALPLVLGGCGKERRLARTRVAIVGGGLAGLTAALRLRDEGMSPVVYEASDRFGGRAWSVEGVLPEGRRFEAGGEFVDASHGRLLGLADRFGLALDDLEELDLEGMRYLFDGAEVQIGELAAAAAPHLPAFLADGAALEQDYDSAAVALDAQTCVEYWDALGITGVFRAVLEVAILTEFGRTPSEVSALHFVEDLPLVPDGSSAGDGTERYRFRDGTQALVTALTDALGGEGGGALVTGARLEQVQRDGNGYVLGFASGATVHADVVLLGLPLPALRQVDLSDIELPPALQAYIAEAGFGAHAKVVVGFDGTPWRDAGYDGEAVSDRAFQTSWDSNPLLGGPGSLTFLLGGDDASTVQAGQAEALAAGFTADMEPLFPGLAAGRNGAAAAINWELEPGFGGSYACLDRGQYTAVMDHLYFGGGEDERQVCFVDGLGFIGEAFSGDHWGYMEGAVETGRWAARHILDELV